MSSGTNGFERANEQLGDMVTPGSPLAVAMADKFVESRVAPLRVASCRACARDIKMMCQVGTDFCSQLCQESAGEASWQP